MGAEVRRIKSARFTIGLVKDVFLVPTERGGIACCKQAFQCLVIGV